MKNHRGSILASSVVAAGVVLTQTAPPAVADPRTGDAVQVTCDNGDQYTVIQRAAQDWNAQLVTDSTSVFHLTSYETNAVLTAADGTVVDTFGPLLTVKGGNDRSRKDLVSCEFALDVDLGDGMTLHVFGPATGWLTPAA